MIELSPVGRRALFQIRGKAWKGLAVGVLLGLSLLLRVVGIGWGIPHYDPALMPYTDYRQSYHIDEDNFLWGLALMEPSKGNFDVSIHHWGTLQFYLIYGALLAGSLLGVVPSPWEGAFLVGNVDALPWIYVLGRLVSVLMGVLATLVVFSLGRALGGWRAGLAGGVAYAIAPLAVEGSHYLTNDITMSALLVSSVYSGVRAVQTRDGRWLFGAGLLLGLATSAKYSAAFGALSLLVAQIGFGLYKQAQESADTRATDKSRFRRAVVVVVLPWLGVVTGFLLGEPYALLTPHILQEGLQQASEGNAFDPSQGIGPPLEMLGWQARNLAEFGMTLPLALLAVGGIAVLLVKMYRGAAQSQNVKSPQRGTLPPPGVRNKVTYHASRITFQPSAVVFAAILGLILGLALNRVHMLRYTHVLLPILAACAGAGWSAISPSVLRWAAGGLAVVVAGWITLGQLSMFAGPHPANSLLSYLQANLHNGDEVARLWPEYPVLDTRKYKLVRLDPWRPDLEPGDRPDYIILDNMALGPYTDGLTNLVAQEYVEVARFDTRPQVAGYSWDEGDTPHDWKYSHPAFRVYARKGG